MCICHPRERSASLTLGPRGGPCHLWNLIAKTLTIAAAVALAGAFATSAQALELAWKGGAVVVATANCAGGWNPLGADFHAYLWPPVTNVATTNPNTEVFTLHESGAEGFRLNNPGVFTTIAKAGTGTHIYTATGQYPVSIQLVFQSPATIVSTTMFVNGQLKIIGFDNRPSCVVTFNYALVKHVEQP